MAPTRSFLRIVVAGSILVEATYLFLFPLVVWFGRERILFPGLVAFFAAAILAVVVWANYCIPALRRAAFGAIIGGPLAFAFPLAWSKITLGEIHPEFAYAAPLYAPYGMVLGVLIGPLLYFLFWRRPGASHITNDGSGQKTAE